MSNRKVKQVRPRLKGYPVAAIKDFFEQLLWEVRVSHYEQCHPDNYSEELGDRIGQFIGKYGAVLLPIVLFKGSPSVSQEQIKESIAALRTKIKDEREEQLRHLEALRPLIAKALDNAERRIDGPQGNRKKDHPVLALLRQAR